MVGLEEPAGKAAGYSTWVGSPGTEQVSGRGRG